MKQILQNIKTGETKLAEVPIPQVKKGHLLIQTNKTLLSAGTERMLVEFGKAGLIGKARKQPEKINLALNKIKTDGIQPTVLSILDKLNKPLPLGYCNVGQILEVGAGVEGFQKGQRVISNGPHAEVVNVPVNLCAKVPDTVSDDEATFTVLGAIALQGIRLAKPTLGETIVVTGLGLIGLITVQLLRANGCRVLGLDFDEKRLKIAKNFGAEVVNLAKEKSPISSSNTYSRGRGVDAVIITASTKSSDPIHQAATMCRKRGRIVLVGVTGLDLHREDFFKKELTFQVSASYGPGRYDPNYEENGQDYPIGFVRWTEQRNFEAILDMMDDEKLDTKTLITHQFSIYEAEKAYEIISKNVERSLGILLSFPTKKMSSQSRTIMKSRPTGSQNFKQKKAQKPIPISFIGAGNYSTAVLIPAFKKTGVQLNCVASLSGVSGVQAVDKFGFAKTTTDIKKVFSDKSTKAVIIASQHESHAEFIKLALQSNKHVFCEKPICITLDELSEITELYFKTIKDNKYKPILTVGFNRRFAPQIIKMKELLSQVIAPKAIVFTVNAGSIPEDHWIKDLNKGGGRIIGEACHFIDLLRFLVGAPINSWSRQTMDSNAQDTVSLQLGFADGSIGTIHYFSNGNRSFPKETLEVFTENRVLKLENFRKMTGYGWPSFKKMNLWRQDKGQTNCAAAFVNSVRNNSLPPIDFEEIVEVSRISIEISGTNL